MKPKNRCIFGGVAKVSVTAALALGTACTQLPELERMSDPQQMSQDYPEFISLSPYRIARDQPSNQYSGQSEQEREIEARDIEARIKRLNARAKRLRNSSALSQMERSRLDSAINR